MNINDGNSIWKDVYQADMAGYGARSRALCAREGAHTNGQGGHGDTMGDPKIIQDLGNDTYAQLYPLASLAGTHEVLSLRYQKVVYTYNIHGFGVPNISVLYFFVRKRGIHHPI